MKQTRNLLLAGTFSMFVTATSARAEEGAEAGIQIEESSSGPTAGEPEIENEEVVEEPAAEPETSEETEATTDPVSEDTPVEIGEVTDETIDAGPEVQRDLEEKGDLGDPDVIFQNTAVDNVPAADSKDTAELGEKAARIETKVPVGPLLSKEKKAPVALVKKGRVFLR